MIKHAVIFLLLNIMITHFAYAEYTCDAFVSQYQATYVPIEHTCNVGEFMPANTLGCVTCPSGIACSGGTFRFSETSFSGLYLTSITGVINDACATNFPMRWTAVYVPNVHTCSPGYYMPANTDGCVACPTNSYCSGGTFTFNETTAQGIDVCPVGTVAPTGMWELEQCGRTLHIGTNTLYLRTTKKTTPALNFDFDGNGIADLYANVTATDTVMNRDSSQKLKLQVGNTTYSVCDDTILGHE